MDLVNYWSPTRESRKFDTTFWTDPTYEKELMATVTITVNALHKSKTEYHGKFGHNHVPIQNIAIMSRIDIFYTAWRLGTQTVASILPGFQCLKRCIQYLVSHPHKPIFILIIIMMYKMSSELHGVAPKLKTTQPRIFWNAVKMPIVP